jgi:4-amino-4-deoxy-L-arabinose transferase-like glycosyltransferase
MGAISGKRLLLKGYAPVLTAFLVAFLIRVYLIWQDGCINPDGIKYVGMATLIGHGDWMSALSYFYPPGYPLLISLAHSAVSNWELAGRMVSLIFGCLVIFPLYHLIKRIYSERIATFSVFLLSITPYHARLSAEVRSEASYIFFTTASLFCLLQAVRKRSALWAGLCGLGAASAYLMRPEGGGTVIVAGAFLILYHLRNFDWSLKKSVPMLTALFLAFSLLSMPYILYLKGDTGKWMVSRKASNVMAIGMHEYDQKIALVSQGDSSSEDSLKLIADHPFFFAQKTGRDLLEGLFIFPEAIHYTFFPFFLIGFITALRRKHPSNDSSLLFLFFVFYLVLFSFFFANRRFLVQLVPVALAWTSIGIEDTAEFMERRLSGKVKVWSVVAQQPLAFLLLAMVLTTLPKTLKPLDIPHRHLKAAGIWLREHTGAADTLMTNRKQIAFYAQRKWVNIPEDPLALTLPTMRENSVDYIAILESAGSGPPSFLLANPEIEKIMSFEGTKHDVINIYAVGQEMQQPEQILIRHEEKRID